MKIVHKKTKFTEQQIVFALKQVELHSSMNDCPAARTGILYSGYFSPRGTK